MKMIKLLSEMLLHEVNDHDRFAQIKHVTQMTHNESFF